MHKTWLSFLGSYFLFVYVIDEAFEGFGPNFTYTIMCFLLHDYA